MNDEATMPQAPRTRTKKKKEMLSQTVRERVLFFSFFSSLSLLLCVSLSRDDRFTFLMYIKILQPFHFSIFPLFRKADREREHRE
jgi:hypothetical protein